MSGTELTIPRGRILFGRFNESAPVPETWMKLGNCPGFTLKPSFKSEKTYRSVRGEIVLDDVHVYERQFSADIVTDNLSVTNKALWFNDRPRDAEANSLAQVAISHPAGNAMFPLNEIPVTNVSASDDLGRTWERGVHFEYDATFNALINLDPTYTGEAETVEFTYLSGMNNSDAYALGDVSLNVEGELRFISENPVGANELIVFHRVRLAPAQSFTLIADPTSPDWSRINLTMEVMKHPLQSELFTRYQKTVKLVTYEQDVLADDTGQPYGVDFR